MSILARLRESAVPSLLDSAALQLRVAKRLAPRRGASLRERLGRLDERLVFVVGSPRSGTTFLAGAIGSMPGFVDLGEVAPVKAAVPELAALESGRRRQTPTQDPGSRAARGSRRLRQGGRANARARPSRRRTADRLPGCAHRAHRPGRERRRLLAAGEALAPRSAGEERRRRHRLRVVRALLGGARSPRGVRARERCTQGGLGLAEVRDRGTHRADDRSRSPLRGAGRRSGLGRA